jgi:glutathione synthase/RimK-type ligase-like ATP-grasp enzyme
MVSVCGLEYDFSMIDCTLVTCDVVPGLDPDDRLLLHELRRRGLTASIEIWNDPRADWSSSRMCILRSTWDYHRRYYDFMAWIDRASGATVMKNDLNLLRWNAHKSYLLDLECRGVPIVPTTLIRRGERCSLEDLAAARGWRDIVLKPAMGSAAHNVTLARGNGASFALAQAQLDRLTQSEDVLVQPYLDAVVSYGERALMFFDGRYSHAVVKKPFDSVFAISDEPSSRVEATAPEIDVATRAVEAVPGRPLYARIDLLRDAGGNARVSEVELIEPALYLAVHGPARQIFADAIERELAIHG